jgi:hypothetical protein
MLTVEKIEMTQREVAAPCNSLIVKAIPNQRSEFDTNWRDAKPRVEAMNIHKL